MLDSFAKEGIDMEDVATKSFFFSFYVAFMYYPVCLVSTSLGF